MTDNLSPAGDHLTGVTMGNGTGEKQVSLVTCDDYDREKVYAAVKQSIDLIGGISRFVSPGQRIFLKFNLLIGAPPDKGVTTHPEVVYAVARILKEHGCSVIMGDSPGSGLAYTEKVLRKHYAVAGYSTVSEELNIPLNYDTGYREVQAPSGKMAKRFFIISPVLDADAVVVVSKAKTHTLTFLSGAVKNLFGVIPGFEKPMYHGKMPSSDDFSEVIIDLNDVVRPKLQVMDAVIGMEGDGPHTGNPRRIGAVLASADSGAIDVVTARLMAFDPVHIGTIRGAIQRGYLMEDLSDVVVVGDDPEPLIVSDYQHPSTYTGLSRAGSRPGIKGKIVSIMMSLLRQYAPWPKINTRKCVGCMKCVRSCPKETIAAQGKKPVITYSNCIRCYCCHEMCDSHAISLERNLFGKILALMVRKS